MTKSFDDLTADALARAERLQAFQFRLNEMTSPAERKTAIMDARFDGFLSLEETTLLIQSYGLETA